MGDLNNALLLAYRQYVCQLEKFETLYKQLGRDTRKVVEYFQKIQTSGDRVALRPFLQ
jgi:hypothetical protein